MVSKPPKPDTNKRQGLQQLRKSDLSGKGAKALSKFVAPIKSVFKLPNIVAKNTLKLGKKILSPVGKLAGAAISKHPLAMMGKGIINMVKGDKGDKGDGGDSMVSSRKGDPKIIGMKRVRDEKDLCLILNIAITIQILKQIN